MRLEHAQIGSSGDYAQIFQFHKGAIRTRNPRQVHAGNPEFQFHKGAIRTLADNPPSAPPNNFNSIKVRLEPKHADDTSYFIGFQFHKGAIRTALY